MPEKIHPTAIIETGANLGDDVQVGPFSIIRSEADIGDGAVIDGHCDIGYPTPLAEGKRLRLGKNARIRSHTIIYAGCEIGENLTTAHHVTIRENTEIGKNLIIGILCTIQGYCTIGDYARFHSYIEVGKATVIKDFVWIFPYVSLTNDPHPPSNTLYGVTIESFAVIAVMSVTLPGINIGVGALVGAGSIVGQDVGAHRVVVGNPAKDVGATKRIRLRDGEGSAYPWPHHFRRGYPPEAMPALDAFLAEYDAQ